MNDDYYQQNAQRFFEETVDVDMSAVYQPFLALLKPGARILDAGCGSGRDTKAFSELGYVADAFDASAELAERAERLIGRPVEVMRFQELTAVEQYDGIWCCASLLHVPEKELPDVMALLAKALKPGGVWYISFKYGAGERVKDGRRFTDMNEDRLRGIASALTDVHLKDIWTTGDRRPDRDDVWVNGLVVKAS
jgi:SAM-dependent methyltransferase